MTARKASMRSMENTKPRPLCTIEACVHALAGKLLIIKESSIIHKGEYQSRSQGNKTQGKGQNAEYHASKGEPTTPLAAFPCLAQPYNA
jgi:hypothetical protein